MNVFEAILSIWRSYFKKFIAYYACRKCRFELDNSVLNNKFINGVLGRGEGGGGLRLSRLDYNCLPVHSESASYDGRISSLQSLANRRDMHLLLLYLTLASVLQQIFLLLIQSTLSKTDTFGTGTKCPS